MGDKVYPAFAIKRVKDSVTVEQVQDIMLQKLGRNCWRTGRPVVEKVDSGGKPTTTFIISGCTLTFNAIRKELFGHKEGDFNARLLEKDFGIVRTKTGAFEGRSIGVTLHEDLERAKQFMSQSLIFIHKDIVTEQLGGLDTIEDTIIFDAPIRSTNRRMIKGAIYICSVSDGTKGGLNQGKDQQFNRFSITYRYRLEALQQLCQLNLNQAFCNGDKSFVVKSSRETGKEEERRCAIPSRKGLGPKGRVIDVKNFVDTIGYVPLEELDPSFFNLEVMQRMVSVCYVCETEYKVLGVDADFSWLAATCGCLASSDNNNWNNQAFCKLSLHPRQLNILNKHFVPTSNVSLVPFLEGISPQYEDPNNFQATALQVQKIEHQFVAREMLINGQCVGRVEQVDFIEDFVTEDGKKYRIFCVRLVVWRNKFWNRDTRNSVGDCNLIKKTEDDWPEQLTPAEMKQNNIKGKLHACIEEDRDGEDVCSVTVVAYVPNLGNIEANQEFVLVPKPPSCEVDRAKRVVALWKRYAVERAASLPQLIAKVIEVYPVKCSKNSGWRKAVRLVFSFADEERVSQLYGLEKQVYVGCDATVKVEHEGELRMMKIPFRVVGSEKFGSAQPNSIVAAVGFIHPNSKILTADAEVDFWVVCRNDWEGMSEGQRSGTTTNAIPADLLDDEGDDEDDDNWEQEVWDEEDDDDSDAAGTRQEDEKATQSDEKSVAPFLKWYVMREDDPRQIDLDRSTDEKALCGMLRRPIELDFSHLDYLLYPNKHISHKFEPLLLSPRNYNSNRAKVLRILPELNPSQLEAVEKMVDARLSIVQGPPGTGKTATASLGISLLHQLEEGLIIASASSNEATDVIYQRLKRDNDRLELGMKIMRMYATSRESAIDNETLDPCVLHHAIQMHPEWRSDPNIARIIDLKQTEGLAMMKEDEKKTLMRHIRRIEMKVMKEQDVLVCTVGAMTDGRVTKFREAFIKKGSGVLAVFVDEASLLTLTTSLNPLTLGSSRVVVLGDFLQLPPVITSPSGTLGGLHVSWMDLLNLIPYVKQKDCTGSPKVFTMLDTQYRMHKQICTLVSDMTYQGRLQTAESVLTREVYPFHRVNGFFGSQVAWIEYEGRGCEVVEGTSFHNPKEVEVIIKLVKKILAFGVNPESISVIGMYESQVAKIKEKVAQTPQVQGVCVGTVDSYQGKENGVVIVDVVRSNNKGMIGFLKDQRRLNVALSRAKFQLVIVGDSKTVKESKVPFWGQVVDFCKRQGTLKKFERL